jgi:hypothetical protein
MTNVPHVEMSLPVRCPYNKTLFNKTIPKNLTSNLSSPESFRISLTDVLQGETSSFYNLGDWTEHFGTYPYRKPATASK